MARLSVLPSCLRGSLLRPAMAQGPARVAPWHACRFASGEREPIVLYGRPSSSNTQKVTWMLEETGIPYTVTLASARIGEGSQFLCGTTGGRPYGVVNTPEYRKMNPHGAIPTICDPRGKPGENCVWESHSIVRYIARAYLPAWIGDTALAQARAEMWMDWVLGPGDHEGTSFGSANHHLIDQVARTPPSQRDMDVVKKAHDAYIAVLSKAESQLRDQRYITGDKPTVADVPLAVELNRWSLGMHALHRDGVQLPMPQWPALAAYYGRMLERPAFLAGAYLPEAGHQSLDATVGTSRRLAGQEGC
mmetsp:Transcript_57726/g.130174  ORF Transcript_57726/g.130174 Transcript_57726/m.130174 type:complete len:305 (-) Transcript_57726:47-961(-)